MLTSLDHIHFTSDILFRCREKSQPRGYSSVEEMETSIIEYWNSKISPTDHIYYLGNFAAIAKGAVQSYCNLIYELNGFKHFIMGPKDDITVFENLKDDDNLKIVEATTYKELLILKQRIVLMHYPIQEWNGKNSIRPSIHLHGGRSIEQPDANRINISFDSQQLIYSAKNILDILKKQQHFLREKAI